MDATATPKRQLSVAQKLQHYKAPASQAQARGESATSTPAAAGQARPSRPAKPAKTGAGEIDESYFKRF
jgi:hypothetical protein